MQSRDTFQDAYREWVKILGEGRVTNSAESLKRYIQSTLGSEQKNVSAVLFPTKIEEIEAIVKIALRHRVPLYPISVGNNWGYGSRAPVAQNNAVVDLSEMNKILNFNAELGVVTIEPGVTVKQLQEYLLEHHLPFLAPASGAGPNVSVLGNILDRGYSASTPVDRFSSLIALEAVMPDATVYRSAFERRNSTERSGYFKWGTGPYLDGLFGQSNFGIVTRATISLGPRQKRSEIFFVWVQDQEKLENIVSAYRNVLQSLGSMVSTMRIQSSRRTFARISAYPTENTQSVIDDQSIKESLKSSGLSEWIVIGAIHGDPRVIRSARGVIREIFGSTAKRICFFGPKSIAFQKRLHRFLPMWLKKRMTYLRLVDAYYNGTTGNAGEENPRLPFWRRQPTANTERVSEIDFDLDPQCGLIFFSPVLPMQGKMVSNFFDLSTRVCKKYGLEPLITFNNFSELSLHVSLPLLFSKNNPLEVENAHTCYRELFEACKAEGIHVYRAGTHAMDLVVNNKHPFWTVAEKIKIALDPHNIVAPGRYSSYLGTD